MAGKGKSGKYRWWPGLLVALPVVVLALLLTARRHVSLPLARPPAATPASAHARVTVALGSFGATVLVDGQPKALTINPAAVLDGSGIWRKADLPPPQVQETVANDFLHFPGLDSLIGDPAAQEVLTRKLQQDVSRILAEHGPGWSIEELRLHPRLGPLPPPAG